MLVVVHPAPAIGGMETNILDLLYSCRPIGKYVM